MLANFVHVWEKVLKTLQCSSGHAKCSCENRAGNFSPKVRKNFDKPENNYKIIIFFHKKKYFSSKNSSGHLQCSSDKPAESLFLFEKKSGFLEKT